MIKAIVVIIIVICAVLMFAPFVLSGMISEQEEKEDASNA